MDTHIPALPRHIGYIIDGNRRWATEHGLPRYEGHLAGYNTIKDIVLDTVERGVQFVSVYIFSTENFKREQSEIERLMGLALKLVTTDLHILQDHGIRLRVLGSHENLKPDMIEALDEAQAKTANLTDGTLCMCFNYGGKLEITDAVRSLVAEGIKSEDITPEKIEQHLYAPEVPAVDVIVRTGGERRLSNFMLWRAAYSEFIFVDKFWPDLTRDDVTEFLREYANRHRRFGGG